MKQFMRTSGIIVAAGLALAACGSATHAHTGASAIKPPPAGSSTKTVPAKYGWHTVGGKLGLILPHVGAATKTILAFSQQDYPFYTEITNPKYWVKSPTFGQWIFVGPYTTGKQYRQVRDAKLAAVDVRERDVLFAQGATTWPSKIGSIDATVYGQQALGNLPSVVAAEQYTAKNDPGKALTLDVPSIATIEESPVGMLTPKMMANTPSQPQISVPGTCIPHTLATYFSGTKTLALVGVGDSPNAMYEIKYGPTNNLASSNYSSVYQPTASCKSMP
jgi:hypothetical protein